MTKNNEQITLKTRLSWFKLDVLDFLGKIEMIIKYLFHLKYYKSLTEKDIPQNTFYCYNGCRIYGGRCPFLDYSKINKLYYCHYERKFDFPLLDDECKICGISEFEKSEE